MKHIRGWLPTKMIQLAAGAAATATLLTACAGPTTTAAPVAGAPAVVVPAVEAPVATNTVAIQNFAFSPATATVKVGTTITWTNQDQDPHTVTAMNNGPFHSPTLSNGQSFHHTFTTPGRFEYLCTIHPFMTATVVVTP